MNALSGRFGMKPFDEKTHLLENEALHVVESVFDVTIRKDLPDT